MYFTHVQNQDQKKHKYIIKSYGNFNHKIHKMPLNSKEESPAAKRRSPTKMLIEPRYHVIQKWSWLVFVMVLGALPLLSAANQDFEHMKSTLESHGQSLHNIDRYLRKTDQFWKWYRHNYERLNELLEDEPLKRTLDTAPSQSLLQRLEGKMNYMQTNFDEKFRKQENEMKSLRETLNAERETRTQMEGVLKKHIEDQGRVTLSFKRDLQQQNELLQECQSSVRDLEQKQQLNSDEQLRILNGTVKSQKDEILKLQEVKSEVAEIRTDAQEMEAKVASLRQEMMDDVDWSFHNVSEKVKDLAFSLVFPLEDKVAEMDQNMTELKDSIDMDVIKKLNELERHFNKKKAEGPRQNYRSQIAGLRARVNNLESSHQTQITNLQTEAVNLDGKFSSLEPLRDRVYNLEHTSNNNGIIFQLDSVQSSLDDLEGQSGKMNLDIAVIQRQVSTLENQMKQSNSLPRQDDTVHSGSGSYRSPTGIPGASGDAGFPGNPDHSSIPYRGPEGPPGRPGSPGRSGGPGEAGSRGGSGRPGSTGNSGRPGGSGEPGAPGLPGNTGRSGRPGNIGSRGGVGVRGTHGSAGAPGSPGLPGPAG